MKNEGLKNVRGRMEQGGKDAIIRSFISKTLQETFEKYGYSPLETSILCYYDLLALKYDDDNDILKEIYKVTDQGNRNLALRYDLTVPFAKLIALNKNTISFLECPTATTKYKDLTILKQIILSVP